MVTVECVCKVNNSIKAQHPQQNTCHEANIQTSSFQNKGNPTSPGFQMKKLKQRLKDAHHSLSPGQGW